MVFSRCRLGFLNGIVWTSHVDCPVASPFCYLFIVLTLICVCVAFVCLVYFIFIVFGYIICSLFPIRNWYPLSIWFVHTKCIWTSRSNVIDKWDASEYLHLITVWREPLVSVNRTQRSFESSFLWKMQNWSIRFTWTHLLFKDETWISRHSQWHFIYAIYRHTHTHSYKHSHTHLPYFCLASERIDGSWNG